MQSPYSPDDDIDQNDVLIPLTRTFFNAGGTPSHQAPSVDYALQQQSLPPIHAALRTRGGQDLIGNTTGDLVDSFNSIYQSVESSLQGVWLTNNLLATTVKKDMLVGLNFCIRENTENNALTLCRRYFCVGKPFRYGLFAEVCGVILY